jgi:hypothetical protein
VLTSYYINCYIHVGLYSSDIGPGHYWFNQITIKSQHSNGNGVIHTLRDDNEATGVLGVSPYDRINMIEYTDAAVACFKLLQYQKSQDDTSPNVYLAADGYPLSRLNILHNTVTKYSELSETNIETLKKYVSVYHTYIMYQSFMLFLINMSILIINIYFYEHY